MLGWPALGASDAKRADTAYAADGCRLPALHRTRTSGHHRSLPTGSSQATKQDLVEYRGDIDDPIPYKAIP